jgi:phytoene/squalene synthetase
MARRKSLREQAGLGKPIGKARRYPVIGSNETISYNEARRRIAALSDRQRNKVSLFERALGRTKNVETARRESRLSQRGLASYRKSFVASDRVSASPWQKEKGRWRFEPERLSYTHTFLDMRDGGRWLSAPFVGRELIAMQDWRSAAFTHESQRMLDAWEKENPAGVVGADGQTYWPETDLAAIRARLKRMTKRERKRIEESIRYKTKGKDQ